MIHTRTFVLQRHQRLWSLMEPGIAVVQNQCKPWFHLSCDLAQVTVHTGVHLDTRVQLRVLSPPAVPRRVQLSAVLVQRWAGSPSQPDCQSR